MANSYNSNPIYLDTDMTSGWRSLQTLSGSPMGIRPVKIILSANGTTAPGNVVFSDPNDGTVLLSIPVVANQPPIEFDFESSGVRWRDFKITGLTATVTKVEIWYRR